MCTLMAAVSAASAVVQYAGQQQATDAYNATAAAGHRDANIAAANKYTDLGRKYVYDTKSTNQEGYRATMKARAEQGTVQASAGAAGIASGSMTLDNLIAQSQQVAAENEARVQAKRDDNQMAFVTTSDSIRNEAQQRINALPFKEGPNPLGMMLSIAGAGITGGVRGGYIPNKIGGTELPIA